ASTTSCNASAAATLCLNTFTTLVSASFSVCGLEERRDGPGGPRLTTHCNNQPGADVREQASPAEKNGCRRSANCMPLPSHLHPERQAPDSTRLSRDAA